MLKSLTLLILTTLLPIAGAGAVEYSVAQPKKQVTASQRCAVRISSNHNITIGELPAVDGVTWLKILEKKEGKLTKKYLIFVPKHTGTLQLPSLPVNIGGENLLIPIQSIYVTENPLHGEQIFMRTIWNGKNKFPSVARIGQVFNLDLLIYVKKGLGEPHFDSPQLNFPNARWVRLGNTRRSRGRQHAGGVFHKFNGKNYQETVSNYKGKEYTIRRYKVRFSVGEQSRLTGKIHCTIKLGNKHRTIISEIDAPNRPLPPLPEGSNLIHTNLIGDWTFAMKPNKDKITAGKPYTVTIHVEGTGDHHRLADLPLAFPGFKSMESKVSTKPTSRLDLWRGTITHKLLPSGNQSTYPALKLTSFNPDLNTWQIHEIQPALEVTGATHSTSADTQTSQTNAQATSLVAAISRPILRNLPPFTLVLFGLAPLLTLFSRGIRKVLDQRDPELRALKNQLSQCRKKLNSVSENEAESVLDSHLLPFLRNYLKLPANASIQEVADNIKGQSGHKELAEILTKHSQASYTGKQINFDSSRIGTLLSKISFVFLFMLIPASQLHAMTLEEANQLHSAGKFPAAIEAYKELINTHPDRANLHYNLANTLADSDKLHQARASYYTALLLDPFHKEAKENFDTLLATLGESSLPGSHLFNLRPDQYLVLAAAIWFLAWLLIALRSFTTRIPRWPSLILILVIVPILIGVAFWKMKTTYAPDQFMVVVEKLSREKQPGKPDLERQQLKSGTIIIATKLSAEKTHILVELQDSSFWLPLDQLTPVW